MNKFYDTFLKSVVYVLFFAIPLLFWDKTYEFFEFNKTAVLSFLCILAGLVWILKKIFSDKEANISLTLVDILALGFLAIASLSAIFSIDPYFSFWGAYEKAGNGLLALGSCIFIYFLISKNRESYNEKELVKLFLGSFSVIGTVFLLMFFGAFSWAPEAIKNFFTLLINAASGLSPALFCILFAINGIVALSYWIKERKQRNHSWYLLSCIISIIILYLLNQYIAWIVLFFFCLALTVFCLKNKFLKEDVNFLLPVLIVLFFSFIFSLPGIIPQAKEGIEGYLRPQIIRNIPQEKNLPFLDSWQIAFQSSKESIESFFIGSGVGTFSYDYSKFKTKNLANDPFWANIKLNRSGNYISEVLATQGIFGFLIYFYLIFLFGKYFFSKAKSESSHSFAPTVILFSLFFLQFIFYQNLVLLFYFWAFLALGAQYFDKEIFSRKITLGRTPESKLGEKIVIFIAIFLFVLFSYVLIRNVIADYYFAQGQRSPVAGQKIEYLSKAASLNPASYPYNLMLSKAAFNQALEMINQGEEQKTQIAQLIKVATTTANLAVNNGKKQILAWEWFGQLYKTLDPGKDKAVLGLKESSKLDPSNLNYHLELTDLYIARGDINNAKTENIISLKLNPDNLTAIIQKAIILEMEEKNDQALALLEKYSQENNLEVMFHLGRLYYNNGQVSESQEQFEKILDINPNYSNALYSLGIIYARRGENTKALQYFQKALELNPGNQDLIDKIQALNSKQSSQMPKTINTPWSKVPKK